jgi:hypothetical protein
VAVWVLLCLCVHAEGVCMFVHRPDSKAGGGKVGKVLLCAYA